MIRVLLMIQAWTWLANPADAIPYGPLPETIHAQQDRALSCPMVTGFSFASGVFRGKLFLEIREDGTVQGTI